MLSAYGDAMKRRSGGKPVKSRKTVAVKHSKAPKAERGRSDPAQETEVARITRERDEVLERHAATSEVLQVIRRSPGDLKPVFAVILENATRICQASFGQLYLVEGDAYRAVAMHNVPPVYVEARQREPMVNMSGNSALARVATEKRAVQIADVTNDPAYRDDPSRRSFVKLTGARTIVAVPMLKGNMLIGTINVYRQNVRSFTDAQVELLTNFAAQAVIAIENARLLNELRQRTSDLTERTTDLTEALEQQTATSEVLQVISSSPGDLEPVFVTMLDNAARICDAKFGNIYRWDGEAFGLVATHNTPPAFAESRKRAPVRPEPKSIFSRLVATKTVVHVRDAAKRREIEKDNRGLVEALELGGVRTALAVPMLKDGELIGCFILFRQEVRPFIDKQIELVKNFAAQAVIAIENARLLNELRQRTTDLTEALEQQTATSQVLQVVSSSQGDLEPVFRAMLENATRICDAKLGVLQLLEGDGFRAVALHNSPPAFADYVRRGLLRPGPNVPLSRMARTKQVVHVADITTEEAYIERDPLVVAGADLGGYRTLLAVPMLRESELIGGFVIFRQEVRPFNEKQIELVRNFAAQAVIAIANARLLSELRQSLERQIATADVLQVISKSPGDLGPVFTAMLEKAVRICDAKFGTLYLRHGGDLDLVSAHEIPDGFAQAQAREPFRPAPDGILGAVMRTGATVHLPDLAAVPSYSEGHPRTVEAVDLGGVRTVVGVPMLKDDALVGIIAIFRQEVRPFADKQIDLLTNFAAQAVIAIENARLLNELRESLEQQTATAEVLRVISSLPGDLEPVFRAMLENAIRICGAKSGNLALVHDNTMKIATMYGAPVALEELRRHEPTVSPNSPLMLILETKAMISIADLAAEERYAETAIVKQAGARTFIGVPMFKDDELIGAISIYRQEVLLFTEKQVELLKNFAAQAVIAIENARLLNELRQRTDDLSASLYDLRTAQDRLVQTEKLASLGQLTAGIAHEIKNPLNFVNNFSAVSVELIDELREALGGAHLDNKLRTQIGEITDMLQGNLDKVVQHGQRADSIVKNMLLHSRQGSSEHRLVDINALVDASLNLAYHGARAEKQGFDITLERSFDPAAGEIDVFPQDITRVLLNLISNGFYAASRRSAETDGGGYQPTLSATTKNLGDKVEITIRDNGTGIPPEVKDKMFNPFFTTKPAGEGTGLGLSISHDIIVKQHAGSIEVDTEPGKFTEFRIVLPRTAASIAKTGGRA
jgi:two-component system, NtrC family, sensor kinase